MARPKATTNPPSKRLKTKVSTGGQWLVQWQKQNPGMFMPGVSMAQAQEQGIAQGYTPERALWAAQDPSWGVAALRQMGSQGRGPLAGQLSQPGSQGVGGEGDASLHYAPSAWLAGQSSARDSAYAAADVQRTHDLSRLGYLSGVGHGADPGNRFSQMNLLERAFGRTLTGLETGAVSSGDRFSGQYQQQLDDAGFERSQQQYGINQDVLDKSEQVNRANASAKQGADQALAAAQGEDVDRWLDMVRQMSAGAGVK